MQPGGAGDNMKLRQHFEGQLSKYTNVMKGWQFRWFVLNPDKGTLDYYVPEDESNETSDKGRQKTPRATIQLSGAVISPSEEDSQTFLVNPISGDQLKLRAVDAKERQEWINRLRIIAELRAQVLPQGPTSSGDGESQLPKESDMTCALSVLDTFGKVKEWLVQSDKNSREITHMVDQFPVSGQGTKCTDKDLLELKATSTAALNCLEECFHALQLQQKLNE